MNKQFKKLQKENDKLRRKLNALIGLNNPKIMTIWITINALIDNEIEQEEYCNQ